MDLLRFESRSEAETDGLGADLAASLPASAVIALAGTLGSGKTRFVQALAAAAGVPRVDVTSPTFVLCQHYQGRVSIHHLDVYRLKTAAEFWDLGADEWFEAEGWTCVEWADRFPTVMPSERLEITIEPLDEQRREFVIRAIGPPYPAVLDRLAERLK